MKSFIIWMVGTLLGAAVGYGLSFLLKMNVPLLILAGIILGNTIAITFNIHREKEFGFDDIEMEDEVEDLDSTL